VRIIGNPQYPQACHRRDQPRFDRRVSTGCRADGPSGAAGRVVLVVGAQKIVPDLDAAMRRVREVVYPWELDDEPPRIKLPMGKAFAHYAGLSGFRARFETILRGMAFGPLGPLAAASYQP
jgi:hypothetical protein